MDLLTTQITGGIIIVAVVVLEYKRSQRSEQLIRAWAEKNDYRLLQARTLFFSSGPFFWKKSRQQTVFRVSIRDEQGRTRNVWILCGNWWGRLTLNDLVVRWED